MCLTVSLSICLSLDNQIDVTAVITILSDLGGGYIIFSMSLFFI